MVRKHCSHDVIHRYERFGTAGHFVAGICNCCYENLVLDSRKYFQYKESDGVTYMIRFDAFSKV